MRAMNPSCWPVRGQLCERSGNVHAGIPFLCLGVNLPAEFQDIWMRPQQRRDLVQLLIGFDVVAKFQPALGGLEMKIVRTFERFHLWGSTSVPSLVAILGWSG